MTTTPTVGSVNLLTDVITKDLTLPAGYDGWALRTIHPDFRSQRGYRYPYPGKVARAPGPLLDHDGECPNAVGDGICAAGTWAEMASGGVPAIVLLLVAWKKADLLGGDVTTGKGRFRRFLIVDVIDGARLLRESGAYANLRYADLESANLRSADLESANLRSANLESANLRYADLGYADLRSANLRSADLESANLRYADLRSADLRYADLESANLRYADLRYADLGYADLRSATNMTQAQVDSAYTNEWTVLPSGLVIPKAA